MPQSEPLRMEPNWRLAWLGFDRLRTADSGEWLDALGILERAGYPNACAKGKWASQNDGTARLVADYLPDIDVTFVGGEPWNLRVSQTCDLEGNPLESNHTATEAPALTPEGPHDG